jgi:SP family sugar:H+ symporter-like MFS transporter
VVFYRSTAKDRYERLLSKDRPEEAKKSLRRIRKKEVTDDEIGYELQQISHAHSAEGKGSWAEVFDKDNRVRAIRA